VSWGVASYYFIYCLLKGAELCARLSGRGVQAYLRLGSGTIVTSDFDARQGSLGLACYTDVTLNAAVVWCDGSGAVFV
jgi:hypothetical protein